MNTTKKKLAIVAAVAGAVVIGALAVSGITRLGAGSAQTATAPVAEPTESSTATPTPTPEWEASKDQAAIESTLNGFTAAEQITIDEAAGEWSAESGKAGACFTSSIDFIGADAPSESTPEGVVYGTWFAWAAEKTLSVPYRLADGQLIVATDVAEELPIVALGCILDPSAFELVD